MTQLFHAPLKILDKISYDGQSEMTEWQLSFLCGLIKENKPHKIVEIGVAAGGTTAVILNCISQLELKTNVYSVDVSDTLYTDNSKKTGYLAERVKKYLDSTVDHQLYTGGISVDFLKKIGSEIDFLILDTMHILPGELLDFLACFPFLKKEAVVVVHDISLHHLTCITYAFATQILLDCVVGEKIIGVDPSEECGYPNIGAFKICCDTEKYIADVFRALLVTWQYLPPEEQIRQYQKLYEEYYEESCLEIFRKAVWLNKKTIIESHQRQYGSKLSEFNAMYHLIQKVKDYNIYIYGYGKFGKELRDVLENCKLKVAGFIVSEGVARDQEGDIPYYLSEIEFNEDKDVILIGANQALHSEIQSMIQKYGYRHYIVPDAQVCKFLER